MNTEHKISKSELELTCDIDFVVPLKQVGLITRAVLEAIRLFYKPRRIIVVTAKEEANVLKELVKRWKCGVVECLEEETFFENNFSLSLEKIRSYYDFNRPGDQREPGWWIQQLIKLGAAYQIKDISPVYVVWDGDLVPTRRWKLCERNSSGTRIWYIAILQSESRSQFNTTQYAQCMEALTGFSPLDPKSGGTFVAHHMVFHKSYVTEMLDLMVKTTQSSLPWPLLIMSYSRRFYRFSEYKTYSTFMLRCHPDDFHYHPLSMFGEGGVRFREANEVIDDMLATCPFSNGGLSYIQVKEYFLERWKNGEKPAYVQLDHVYGLDGVDLNLAGPIPASRANFSLRVFSQLKEVKSVEDIPEDLFTAPVNVAVVKNAGGVMDDSAIQRMTIGAIMRTPFAAQQNAHRTTPRRPVQQKYYLGGQQLSRNDWNASSGTIGLNNSNRMNIQSLFIPPNSLSTVSRPVGIEPMIGEVKSPWIKAV